MDVDIEEVEALEALLGRDAAFKHLYVKKHGKSLKICSGDPPWPHARITALGRDTWGLSFPTHTGRWERTPFVGTMEEVTDTLINNFGFYLDDIA